MNALLLLITCQLWSPCGYQANTVYGDGSYSTATYYRGYVLPCVPSLGYDRNQLNVIRPITPTLIAPTPWTPAPGVLPITIDNPYFHE